MTDNMKNAVAPFGARQTVTTRPCRACGQPCDVTAAGMDALKTCNRILLERGDAPLNEYRVFACERCEMHMRGSVGRANRETVDEMAAIIRDLREAVDPAGENEMIQRLKELGHPDTVGLLHGIGERKAAEKQTKRGRS